MRDVNHYITIIIVQWGGQDKRSGESECKYRLDMIRLLKAADRRDIEDTLTD
jgi:hypothetical protein